MKRVGFCVFVVALLIAPCVANALVCTNCSSPSSSVFNYQFLFQGDGLTVNLSGQLTASTTVDLNAPVAGGFDVLSINGTSTITGLSIPYSYSISGLVPVGAQPGFLYDNILYYPPANIGNGVLGYFDQQGILFTDAAGTIYAIYTDIGSTGDPLLFGNPNTGLISSAPLDLVNGNISPVPEASTWVMLLMGFATLGVIAGRHKHRAVHCSG